MSAKLPRYRLQPILDQKLRKKKDAEEALAEAQKALRAEEDRKVELEEQLEQIRREKQEARRRRQEEMLAQGGMGAALANRTQDYVHGAGAREERKQDEIADQVRAIEKAALRLEEQKLILLDAARDAEGMEKHKAEWIDNVKREIADAEAKEMDEIGNAMFQNRRMKEKRG